MGSSVEMNILIFTRYNKNHGFGHISRAREFLKDSVEFFTKKNIKANFIIQVLVDNASDLSLIYAYFSGLSQLENIQIEASSRNDFKISNAIDFGFIDCIKIDKELFDNLKESSAKLISLSPMGNYISNVDVLFARSNVILPEDNNSKVKLKIGSQFSIFRKIETKPRRDDEAMRKRIIFFIGGPNRPKIIDFINRNLDSINIKDNPYKKIVISNVNNNFNNMDDFEVYDLENFLFYEDDLIVTSGGLSFMESAYSGCKTLNFFLDKSHSHIADETIFSFENVSSIGLYEETAVFLTKFNNALNAFESGKGVNKSLVIKNPRDDMGACKIWDELFSARD